jgi:hypothetical protein
VRAKGSAENPVTSTRIWTNPMKTKVAGLSVLPSKNAAAAAADAFRRRNPMTAGAAQQVHIMPAIAGKPAVATLPKLERP